MENRIKECQLDLFADRTSTATMRANQLRLWFASMAYVLLCALRRIGLAHTQFAQATCGTIRLKLLKLGALVRISVRRIKVGWLQRAPFSTSSAWRMRGSETPQPDTNQTAQRRHIPLTTLPAPAALLEHCRLLPSKWATPGAFMHARQRAPFKRPISPSVRYPG